MWKCGVLEKAYPKSFPDSGKDLKERILAEAGQPVTICYQFKLRAADGKSGVKCRV